MSKPEEPAAVEIDESSLEEISGGPVYVKVDGITGKGTPTVPTTDVTAALGDGSVRTIGG